MPDIELTEEGRRLPPPEAYRGGGKRPKRKLDKATGEVYWESPKDTFKIDDWVAAPALLVQPTPTGYPLLTDRSNSWMPSAPEEVLDYILDRGNVVTYSPNKEVHSIFKLFGQKFCQELAYYRGHDIPYEGYWVRTTGNKSLLIRKGNRWGRLSNFHRLQPDDFDPTVDNLEATSQEFYKLLQESGIELANPSSPGAIGQAYLLQMAGNSFPCLRTADIDREHLARAYNTWKAGRMEALQVGHFDKLYNYDFTNQYASILGELQDCRPDYTEWIDSKEYQPSAFYGFVQARVTIPESWLSPMTFRLGEHNLNFPFGTMVAWIAKPELDLLYKMGCQVNIIEGSWGMPMIDCKPFNIPMQKLYHLRDSKFTNAVKAVAVAAIGKIGSTYDDINPKTGEVKEVASATFNPIYIAHLLSEARVRLYNAAILLGDRQQLVSLTVDGILSLKEVAMPKDRESGKLRYVGGGEALIVTDYYKDKPTMPSKYREMLLYSGNGHKFRMAAEVYRGLEVFNRKEGIDAHLELGKSDVISWDVRIGSAVRHTPRITAEDLLRYSYPTDVMEVMDLVDVGRNNDYIGEILFGNLFMGGE